MFVININGIVECQKVCLENSLTNFPNNGLSEIIGIEEHFHTSNLFIELLWCL